MHIANCAALAAVLLAIIEQKIWNFVLLLRLDCS